MILRAVKDSRWSAINNTVLNDERLSWRARGIAAYLLTKPDDWRIDHTHLWRAGREGRDAVLTAMKELETCRYLVRRRYQKTDGTFSTEVQLHETPQTKPRDQETDFQGADPDAPTTAFQEPTTENQESVNQKSVFQDSLLVLKPITERKGDEDDPHVRDAIHAAWFETYEAEMPPNQESPVAALVNECGEAAVVHGIRASINAESRSFRFIAKCARNYIPPAAASNGATYRVDIPTAPALPTGQASLPTLPAPAPAHSDPWATALAELRGAYTLSDWVVMLDGSRLESNGGAVDADGQYVPRYRVLVAPGVDVQRLANRALRQIRFTLGSLLVGKFMLEIVPCGTGFAEPVLEPTP